MERLSTSDPAFLATVSRWLDADREVFVVIRYPNRGGVKSYELSPSLESLSERLAKLPASTSVVVCKGKHLSLRGTVDNSFIAAALEQVSDGDDWLIVGQLPMNYGIAWWFPESNGNSHRELESELRDDTYFGQPVYAGVVPPWWEGDSDTIISAYVPNSDGSITPAAY